MVNEVQFNKGFAIASHEATSAKEAALNLQAWMGQNPQGVGEYDHFLTGLFNLWITSVPPTDSSAREKIWSRFSQFVSSKDYVAFWSSLYNKSGIQGTPILAFFITYTYFTRHWTTMYPIEANSTCSVASYNEASHLSPDEENALWYVAGYVIRKVMKSLRSGASQEVIQIATLLSFIEDGEELDDDISDDQGDETLSTAWFDAINRGGLFKCTNDFYKFMRVLELQVKCHLHEAGNEPHCHIGRVDQVSDTISKEPRVSDAWITLLDEATDTHTTLLKAIVCIYFKVRMYGYTNKKMEQFKQSTHTQLQKSKSLRSRLNAEQ